MEWEIFGLPRQAQAREECRRDVVLIDNGAIQMKVLAKSGNKVECEEAPALAPRDS